MGHLSDYLGTNPNHPVETGDVSHSKAEIEESDRRKRALAPLNTLRGIWDFYMPASTFGITPEDTKAQKLEKLADVLAKIPTFCVENTFITTSAKRRNFGKPLYWEIVLKTEIDGHIYKQTYTLTF